MSPAEAAAPVCEAAEAEPRARRARAGIVLGPSRLREFAFSVSDQAFAVGGMFVVNIALARVSSKEEYGIFALSYSLFTFLAGLHNAAILEAYTVYGAGRYHARFAEYARFVARRNRWLLAALTVVLLVVWGGMRAMEPEWASLPLLGMALSAGVLLGASFRRRTFYIARRPERAALFSGTFFFASAALLAVAVWARRLNGLAAFLVVATAWLLAFALMNEERNFEGENRKEKYGGEKTAPGKHGEASPSKGATSAGEERARSRFDVPGYWREHWRYSRWVLATALVFQFTTQAYFWAVAAFLSVGHVAALRALYNLALPIDQVYTAITLLVLPQMALYFSLREPEKLKRLWRRCSLAYLGLSSAFALVVASSSLPILHLVYGGKFDDAAPLLAWYVLVPLVMGVGHAANAVLKAMERSGTVLAAYLASGATTFVIGIPLVVRLGLRGAIYGMLVSGLSYTVVLTASCQRAVASERRSKIALDRREVIAAS